MVKTMSFLIENRPTLTCMIQARTPQRIYELIENGLKGGTDAFGIQLEILEAKYRTPENLKAIFSATQGKPIYVTNYRGNQNEGKNDDILAEELLELADCGATLIDVMGDMFSPAENQITYDETAIKKQIDLINKIHTKGKEVLISSHTSKYLPYDDVIKIAEAHKSRGTDIAKIVTAANSEAELINNFKTSSLLAESLDIPFLFLCGGTFSPRHRRVAPIMVNGMFLCVAEHDEFSTKEQPILSDAKSILDLIC